MDGEAVRASPAATGGRVIDDKDEQADRAELAKSIEYPAEGKAWLVWERATDGGRPWLRAVDVTEQLADRHCAYLRMAARMSGEPVPDLIVEETRTNHLYAANLLAAISRRSEKRRRRSDDD